MLGTAGGSGSLPLSMAHRFAGGWTAASEGRFFSIAGMHRIGEPSANKSAAQAATTGANRNCWCARICATGAGVVGTRLPGEARGMSFAELTKAGKRGMHRRTVGNIRVHKINAMIIEWDSFYQMPSARNLGSNN